MATELKPEQLKRSCDPELFDFETTEECEPLQGIIGQQRAVKALELGLGIHDFRYNIYVAGSSGTGKTSTVKGFLERASASGQPPSDWCYVHNFDQPYCPVYLELPAGMGCRLQADMGRLIKVLERALPDAFNSSEYQQRRQAISRRSNERRDQLFNELAQQAQEAGFTLQRTEIGIKTVPLHQGQAMSEEQFLALDERQRKVLERKQQELQSQISEAIRQVGLLEEERARQVGQLDEEVATFVLTPRIVRLEETYHDCPRVLSFLQAAQADILKNLGDFLPESAGANGASADSAPPSAPSGNPDPLRKYQINVIVDNSQSQGAPVVVLENATYPNLFGKLERRLQYGVMTSDFTLIRTGALHRANGGYLVLNAENLLKYWTSWESLKIAIRSRLIQLEDPGQMMGYPGGEGLQPEPIPLDVKVILIGNHDIYLTLQAYDEEFHKLFNVKCDFDDRMDWQEEHIKQFGCFIRARCEERRGLKPFHKSGVARVAEYASALTEDQRKLSARFSDIMTVVREASYWAEQAGVQYVLGEQVEQAIEEKIYRHNMIEERIQEMITRGDILVDVEGAVVGQVNGLYVVSWGDFTFGHPARITANVFTGKDGLVNIEREAELSGKIHTKGLLILKGWLGEHFAWDKPLSLSASLTFEQSYSLVDGDSASSTELYALISALSGTQLKQGIAVTGSVNQKGQLQPIGGVNEKIEGFFAVCKAKGLTGKQGVMIPQQNIGNLALKREVIEAVCRGEFHIWAVRTIDEGIELLTGESAGQRLEEGGFERGTIYERVDQHLRQLRQNLDETHGEEDEE